MIGKSCESQEICLGASTSLAFISLTECIFIYLDECDPSRNIIRLIEMSERTNIGMFSTSLVIFRGGLTGTKYNSLQLEFSLNCWKSTKKKDRKNYWKAQLGFVLRRWILVLQDRQFCSSLVQRTLQWRFSKESLLPWERGKLSFPFHFHESLISEFKKFNRDFM